MATNSNISIQKNPWGTNAFYNLRSPGWFAKWPLIGITMFLLGSMLFGALAYEVKTNGSILQWDTTTAKTMQAEEKSIPPMINEYVIFGFYVGRELVIILAVILGLYFLHKRYWRELMMVLWGPGLGGLLWYVLSQYFARPRPPTQMDIVLVTVPSFPSGHTVSAVLGYGLLAYLVVPRLQSRFWKWVVSLFLLFVIVFVGVSRLLVGGHYLSDVLAGYGVGIAWAGLVYTLAERFFPREQTASTNVEERPRTEDDAEGLRSPGMFKRWPLIGIALILIGGLSFAALGYSLQTNSPLVKLDQSLYENLITSAKAASPTINELMLFGFFLGKQMVIVIVTLLAIYFASKHYWREAAMILLSSAAGSFVWNYFVSYFNRPRPPIQTGLPVKTIPSFPSGHAMSAMIVYGFLAYLIIPKMPTRAWKWTVGIVALVIILFDGYSRIYQGSHYLTDVLAGYALGLAWAVLVYTVIEVIFMRRKNQNV